MVEKRDLTRENLERAFGRLADFVEHPEKLDEIPQGVTLVDLPVGDPELLEHNIKALVRDIIRRCPPGTRIAIKTMKPEGEAETEETPSPQAEWLAVSVG